MNPTVFFCTYRTVSFSKCSLEAFIFGETTGESAIQFAGRFPHKTLRDRMHLALQPTGGSFILMFDDHVD